MSKVWFVTGANSGIGAGFCVLGNFEDLSGADFERQLATNFFGAIHVMHAALPILRKQQSGQIFNISSVAGAVGMAHCSAYSASKFALEGLSSVTLFAKGAVPSRGA